MSADGDPPHPGPSIEVDGAAGQGAADWSPEDDGSSPAAKTPGVRRCSRFPCDGGAPIRLVDGKWVNPVWSPDGS